MRKKGETMLRYFTKAVLPVALVMVFLLSLLWASPVSASTNSWQQQDPLVNSISLQGVWGSSGSDVFAVGSCYENSITKGVILHYDGSNCSRMAIPGVAYRLCTVWGSSASDVFAVGESTSYKSLILHYDGSDWHQMIVPTLSGGLAGVWGSSASDVFAVGIGGILHYDGSDWGQMTLPSGAGYLYGVWGSSASDVFAVGESTSYKSLILRYDGSAWSQMTAPSGVGTLKGVWGSSASNVFAVGDSGVILHYTGSIWGIMHSGVTSYLYSVWGNSASDIFAMCYGGYLHYDGNAWSQMTVPTGTLYGVWGSSASDVFAVGSDNTLLHYDGSAWSFLTSGGTSLLDGVWGSSPSDVFAVGAGGTILHYNGSNWRRMPNPSTSYLKDIWGSSASDVFAVGSGGTILHYDGSAWSQMTAPSSTGYLLGVWGSSASDVFAVDENSRILHYNGSAWSKMTTPSTPGYLYGVWGSSASDVLVVGYKVVLHYDGSAWSKMTVPSDTGYLYGVWGSSASNVFAVGASGTVLHYNGNSWSYMESVTSDEITSVWGTSGSDVFAVDESSRILHYDGSNWGLMTVPSGTDDLAEIWGSSASDLFAVCSRYILHYGLTPYITAFSPTKGGNGTPVTITGANFSGTTAVRFGGSQALTYTVDSDTQITATAGSGATGNITVTTSLGTANSSASFTYFSAPTIASFTPVSGKSYEEVTITGANFTGATAVSFGGTAAALFSVYSDTQIQAYVGAGASGPITVTTPGGTATSSGTFNYIPAITTPSISSFTPASGISGTSVTITGANLSGATAVSFGGTAAASFAVDSATQITAVVGSGSSGVVSVTTSGGTAYSPTSFTYYGTPTITSFTPASGISGTAVIITGANLAGASAVSFGGTAAAEFTVDSSTQITATVGSGSSGSISVVTPGGTATSATSFSYSTGTSNPTITSFTPSSGPGGTSVTINGTNLSGATAVSFGGTAAASFTVNSSTKITAVVGSGSSGKISVTTAGGTAVSGDSFIYTTAPAPVISSFTPSSGPSGTTVTINGINLSGATAVSFGGTAAASFTVNSSTKITAVVGSGSSGQISVTTPGGTASSSASFTYLALPAISSFNPLGGTSGTVVTITGANLSGATVVKFGTTPAASFSVVSATQITAVVGSGASGPIAVTTSGGNAVSAASFTYYSAPKISSFTPAKGGPGTLVTISGANLSGATAVSFGGIEADNFSVISPAKITAYVANGASGPLAVTTPGGTIATTKSFTFFGVPTIASFSPDKGGKGTTVTISGTNFSGATVVKFGGTKAASLKVDSATQITAKVGAGASGQISVTTPGGSVTSADEFTFYGVPKITAFTPSSGGQGLTLTITGAYLGDASEVTVGGTAVESFSLDLETQITAVVGSGATGKIKVTTPGGTASSSKNFTFYGVPTIASFAPVAGGNKASVVITGVNLKGATAVSFGGLPAASFKINSATQITAKPGNGASGLISVTTPGGIATSAESFTFYPVPAITSISPLVGGAGTALVISGSNFDGATVVKIGSKAALSFTVDSGSQITAVVGSGATGKITVTTPGGSAVSVDKFTWIAAPVIKSFTPASGGSATTVIIKGSKLKGASAVSIGGVAVASFSVDSDTQITAVVDGGATGQISVTTPGGTALSSSTFTFTE
jgi:hypothetical protein